MVVVVVVVVIILFLTIQIHSKIPLLYMYNIKMSVGTREAIAHRDGGNEARNALIEFEMRDKHGVKRAPAHPPIGMMTSSNGNIFRVTDPLCGNPPVTGEFPAQRPVTRSFDVIFDLRMNTQLSKQSWGWYLRRHRAHYDVMVMGWRQIVKPLGCGVKSKYL